MIWCQSQSVYSHFVFVLYLAAILPVLSATHLAICVLTAFLSVLSVRIMVCIDGLPLHILLPFCLVRLSSCSANFGCHSACSVCDPSLFLCFGCRFVCSVSPHIVMRILAAILAFPNLNLVISFDCPFNYSACAASCSA